MNIVLVKLIFILSIVSIAFILLDQRILAQNQTQNSSGSLLGISLVDLVNIVQIVAGIATAVALVYAALTFKQSRQYNMIRISNDFLKDLTNLQREIISLISQARVPLKEDTELLRSIYQYLSTVEWFCFLVNIKDIKDKRIINLFWPIIGSADTWYKIYFNTLYERDLDNNMFSNLKKLYSDLEADDSTHRIHPFEALNPQKEG